jgi:hypothetical protein
MGFLCALEVTQSVRGQTTSVFAQLCIEGVEGLIEFAFDLLISFRKRKEETRVLVFNLSFPLLFFLLFNIFDCVVKIPS